MSKDSTVLVASESLEQSVLNNWSWYEIAKDFLPTIATLVAAVLSIRFAVLQIKKQHQNSLDLQASEHRKKIQIELFEEIQERLDKCSSLAQGLSTSMIFKTTFLNAGVDPNHDESTFTQEISEVLKAITTVTIFIEHREVVNPKLFRVARSALHSAHHDLMEVLKKPKMQLQDRYSIVSKAAGNASNYCHDLNICIQNEAFGDIFSNEVPVRQPIDPNEKVIINDEETLEELLHYFEHESSYGQQIDKINAEVSRQYENG